ncbi:MAG: MotA/TolQ/ExbB proton channel family protein [Nitrospirota bacterium]|nr:MotA/TolQ/ExbB proton channel family protein [Nitrospirota bacterium]
MDLSSAIGMVAGVALIFGAIFMEGNARLYLSLHGFMITFGGVLASLFIAYPLKDVLRTFRYVRAVFFVRNAHDLPGFIDTFEEYARVIRREGPIAMERAMERFDDEFYKQGCQLVADGIASDKIEDILSKDIEGMQERHKVGQEMFRFGVQAGPAFGLIGAVIGIIQMLGALGEGQAGPETIARMAAGMSIAMCATLYGITLAYLIFAPIAQKLSKRSDEEVNEKLLLMEGILALQAGDPAPLVRQRMEALMPPAIRKGAALATEQPKGQAAAGL